jgi:predicted MFS family arabinose efflux permease
MLLPLVSLARGLDLVSLLVLLGIAAFVGVRRDATWTDAVGRAIDLSIAGLLVVAAVLVSVTLLPRAPHDALTIALFGAWVVAVVVSAGLALTTEDQPRWRPLLRRALDVRGA